MTSILSRSNRSSTPAKESIWDQLSNRLNFYRIHLLFFTFTPLVFSGIFYACNGRYKISYIDSLFNCVSAMTVCGLASINLSSLTPFQQVLLFILMCMGNPVIVSWVIVYMRRYFFAQKFEDILKASVEKKVKKDLERGPIRRPWHRRLISTIAGQRVRVVDGESLPRAGQSSPGGDVLRKLRPDMIRRMDDAPKLINPSGWVSEGHAPSTPKTPISPRPSPKPFATSASDASNGSSKPTHPSMIAMQNIPSSHVGDAENKRRRRLSDPGLHSRPTSPASPSTKMRRFDTIGDSKPKASVQKHFPRHQTIEFAPDPQKRRDKLVTSTIPENGPLEEENMTHEAVLPRRTSMPPEIRRSRTLHTAPSVPMSTRSTRTHFSHRSFRPDDAMTTEFGGFPSPFAVIRSLFKKLFPGLQRQLTRALTIPTTVSLAPAQAGVVIEGKKHVPYISFDAIVGRNSAFHLLTNDQLEEIGGVEYRALNALLWIVGSYHIMVQLISFTIVAPYISTKKWAPVFDEQIRSVNTVWFSAFQVVSAYTNCGTSLVDESLVPFQKAYPMVYVVMFLILAGNTSFPVFLRFMIWCISKMVHKTSRLHETLHFLLDHPRRCFIYLFPSHQTWFLFWAVVVLTFTDWFFVLVLDIHNPPIDSIPGALRVSDGLMQAVAVRSGGFSIIPVAAVAPAVQVLFVIMMYISAYPIAMSVRSTNVYEEQSLGIFDPHEHDGTEDDASIADTGSHRRSWGRYLTTHARKQLAFDMWFLGLSLFVICIIEKNNLENPANYGWFNIFRVIFELVSAYGTVGLSLGIPDQNYSFVGAMHTLSKLVICLVMLRGRHRSLPVAIDRAIMLPYEFKKDDDDAAEQNNEFDNDDQNHEPFTYSETMGSRYNSEMRQRLPRRSTNGEQGHRMQEGLGESQAQIADDSPQKGVQEP